MPKQIRPDPVVLELARRRIALGLSQEAVARRVGTRGSRVSELESGRYAPTLTTLRAWARALGYDIVLEPVLPKAVVDLSVTGGRHADTMARLNVARDLLLNGARHG